jgi:hypothetical protein
MIRSFFLLFIWSCSDLVLRIDARPSEPWNRPPHDPRPATYINGVETESLEIVYDSVSAAIGTSHLVELRHGEVVIASRDYTVRRSSCFDEVGRVTELGASFCTFDSGDVRSAGDLINGTSGTCIGDAFCLAACRIFGCEPGMRCASLIALAEPLASRLACVPIGPAQLEQACRVVDGGDGAYDDCGLDLVCVEGLCRARCGPTYGTCDDDCSWIPGHPPEVRVCM